MSIKRIYLQKLFKVEINNIEEIILIGHFSDDQCYTCIFNSREASGLYHLFDSFGFYVNQSNGVTKYSVNGKFTEINARSIWSQVERIIDKPITTHVLPVSF